jgi:hypothetical protein
MKEEDTYRKLKQIPWTEMNERLDPRNYKQLLPGPVYALGSLTVEASKYYNRELDIHSWRMTLLAKYGWTFEEFMLEGERRAIIDQVKEINGQLALHNELVERAKVFFPNLKLVQASIELE